MPGIDTADPLAALAWSDGDYELLAQRVTAWGPGRGRVLAFLEGGYDLRALRRCVTAMVGGLLRGLDHEHTAKFAFLLATPVILAAGVLKLPTLAGPQGDGILGQVFVGAVVAGVSAYLAVRFLERFFKTRTLFPFAVYSLIVGLLSVLRFA